MTKFNSENPDPRNRFNFEEEGLNLDDMLKFIEEIKKHGFKASNPKAQEILKKFPHKLQEYLIEIEKIKKDKEKENPNKTPEEKEKRKKENSERSNKIAQELFIIACASEMPMDKALQFHENCRFGVKELSQFGENGLSPLSAMMLSDKSPQEMQKVIDKGADINEKSPSGMTVTDLAVLVGNEKMVETLKQEGGKLNLVSKERGREKEVEEEREKGREKSREREQEKQQRQIQKKQEFAQREQEARELKQQRSQERIQQQQIAQQMQMVIMREAMQAHEENLTKLLKKKKELQQKIKEESDVKLREPEQKLKDQIVEFSKEQQLKIEDKQEEKKIEKSPISELEKILGIKLPNPNIDKLLFDAVNNGQQSMAISLVSFGGNVNHKENGISVLGAAVRNGNNSLIQTLLISSTVDTVQEVVRSFNSNSKNNDLSEMINNKKDLHNKESYESDNSATKQPLYSGARNLINAVLGKMFPENKTELNLAFTQEKTSEAEKTKIEIYDQASFVKINSNTASKKTELQVGNLNAVEAARNFKDDPEIIERYTVFNSKNVYRSAREVLELHDATGADIMPRGNATNPDDIIGVGLVCFRPERIAKQLTLASVNMQAKIDEESFPRIVDDVFSNYVAKEMASVVPQVNQMRLEIERNVEEASKALQGNPTINTEGNEVLTKVKEARDEIRQKAECKTPPVSEESINDTAAKYATDLIYNGSPEIFKLVEDAVARGMKQAVEEGKYEPLSQSQNNERVAIVVAGGPASGKTQATEMALHSLEDSRDVMAFSTDQLRTLVSPGETGGPAFTDLEANLVFRQIIGKMDKAMKSDVAPTILSEGTSLNPEAINHLLTGGAEVHASLISIPAEVALERAGKRAASDKAADQGRSYSDEYLLELHKQDGMALPNITSQLQGKNVQLSIFDNNVERGQSPELIGRMNLQTMEMEIYNVQKLAELEQKGKIDPTQSKGQGMYSPDDKLPENNISFLTHALNKFSVTFKNGEMGEEYAASKSGEKLTITDQALFDSKQENSYHRTLTSPFLEEDKKIGLGSDKVVSALDSEVVAKFCDITNSLKKSGIKFEEAGKFVETIKHGKSGNIGSKGGTHNL